MMSLQNGTDCSRSHQQNRKYKGNFMTTKLITALLKAQREIKPPKKSAFNSFHKNHYATLDDVYEACLPVLNENELILSHTVEMENDRYILVTTIYHVSGELMTNKFPMSPKGATSQDVAAARTYACRYSICNLLALPQEEDDDGNRASLTLDQQKALKEAIGHDEDLANKVLGGYEKKYKKPVRSFADIKQEDFGPAMARLKSSPKPISVRAS